ncbi:MAG: hypothetical protein DME97_09120 [Verrucomicrobia bacterium]|nr:MAG: hypothetical protein DME97_09120 [Verrucomicrobiota bacterium]
MLDKRDSYFGGIKRGLKVDFLTSLYAESKVFYGLQIILKSGGPSLSPILGLTGGSSGAA